MSIRNVKPTPTPPRSVFVLRVHRFVERVQVQVVDFYPARQVKGKASTGQAARP